MLTAFQGDTPPISFSTTALRFSALMGVSDEIAIWHLRFIWFGWLEFEANCGNEVVIVARPAALERELRAVGNGDFHTRVCVFDFFLAAMKCEKRIIAAALARPVRDVEERDEIVVLDAVGERPAEIAVGVARRFD